ncbi:MAG: hypothetical protein WCJ93_04350 [Methanomicrobiales archaeon]
MSYLLDGVIGRSITDLGTEVGRLTSMRNLAQHISSGETRHLEVPGCGYRHH